MVPQWWATGTQWLVIRRLVILPGDFTRWLDGQWLVIDDYLFYPDTLPGDICLVILTSDQWLDDQWLVTDDLWFYPVSEWSATGWLKTGHYLTSDFTRCLDDRWLFLVPGEADEWLVTGWLVTGELIYWVLRAPIKTPPRWVPPLAVKPCGVMSHL